MEDTIQEVSSPDNKYIAKIYEQDCGATVDFSTIVYITQMQRDNKKHDDSNTIFITSGRKETRLEWKDSYNLNLYYKGRKDEIFLQEERFENINILYIFEGEEEIEYKKTIIEQFIDFIENKNRTDEDINNFIKDHNLKEEETQTKAIRSLWNDVKKTR